MNYTKEQLEAVIKDQLHADMKPLAYDALKWRKIAEGLAAQLGAMQCGEHEDYAVKAALQAYREAGK